MSISVLLQQLETEQKLCRFVAKSRRKSQRRLYLSDGACREFNDANSAVNLLTGQGYLKAAFTRWVLGDRVFGLDGKPRFLKELDPPPPDIWEIRITEPAVQARLLGAFIEQDTLVLLRLRTRGALGKKGGEGWTSEMKGCASDWATLFPGVPRLHADNVSDYIGENFDGFKLKR